MSHDWIECGLSHSNMFIYKCKNCDSKITSSLRPDSMMLVNVDMPINPENAIRGGVRNMTCDMVISAKIHFS